MEEQDFKVNSRKQDYEKSNTIRKMWEIMAQRPSDFDMQVIDALKATITGTTNDEQIYGCYGEQVYLVIRKHLMNYKTIDGKNINFLLNTNTEPILDKHATDKLDNKTNNNRNSPKKIDKKSEKKTDIIRFEATMKKLNERLSTILKSLNINNFTIPSESVMHSNILELRAIGFIYITWFISYNKEKYTDKLIPFSAIVSLQRFISLLSTSTNRHGSKNNDHIGYGGYNTMKPTESMIISNTLINDLKAIEKTLIKQYAFNGVALYEQASDLILGSQFDYYLPRKSREAFEHQKIVSNTIMEIENLKNGFIMFYRTMTNSGKTSTIINIATAVQELRKRYPNVFGDLQVIATCDVQPVLTRWGQLLYHAGIPFGVGAKRFYPSNPEIAQRIKSKALKELHADRDCIDINMRFSNSDTCKSISDRCAIICPTEIALKILAKGTNARNRFILLHDEPTMHADCPIDSVGYQQLLINMQVMQYAPKWAIFSSATLPFDAKSQSFIDHHKSKFPNAKFIDNCSTEIYSCCNMRTFDGKLITPHLGCTTRTELINAVEHIEKNPFLGKLYTPTSVKLLWEEAMEAGANNADFKEKIPNITEFFSKVENLYPDNVRKIALDILRSATLLNDKQIAYICSMEYESDSEDEDTNHNPTGIVFDKLGTTEAHKFPYLNLIASNNPMQEMQSHYGGLVLDIKKKIGSLDKIETDYDRAMDLWQNTFDALEKQIKNPDQLSMAQSDMYESKPNMSFPEECQINTKQHVMKYAKHSINRIANTKMRIPNNINNFKLGELHITDDCKLQMLAGVGAYAKPEDNPDIDGEYLDTTLELTSQKKMETLIADSSICYGTDYPIGGVIITKDFSNCHSLNTIYQLMSRAGRGRKSNNAEIYVDGSCAMQILDTVKQGVNAVSSEIDNMIAVFEKLIK
jgi:hypothetical protein